MVNIKFKCKLNAYLKQQVENMKNDVVDSEYRRWRSNTHKQVKASVVGDVNLIA